MEVKEDMNTNTAPSPVKPERFSQDELAVLTTEMRTLKERIVIMRAKGAALEHKVAMQAQDLEKYHHALVRVTDNLNSNQNLTRSFQDHMGLVLVNRARWLRDQYHKRGLRGRLQILPRVRELLDFQSTMSEVVYSHPEWPALHAELDQIRTRRWYRQILDPRALKRTLVNFTSRFRSRV